MEARKRSISNWNIPRATKGELLRFISDLDLGKVNKGRKISASAQLKYLNVLKAPLENFNKPMAKVTVKDVERFEQALSSDGIKSWLRKRPYSHSTKVGMRKALKVFFRWRLGVAKAARLVGWLDTHDRETTPDFLTEREVEQLYRKCATAEHRFIVAVLFDSGARAEEFINIRFEDIHFPEGKETFVKVTLKEEYSKTKGRTISLYWRHSLDAVTEYVKERIAQGLSPKDPVFDSTYDAMRMFLLRHGQKVLKRRIYPHLFRHTSATYYATKLNRQELCYRYGWRFSSNMPDVYISRSGMENKELDVRFTNTELGNLKDELATMAQGSKIKDDRVAQLEKEIRDMQNHMRAISKVLATNPSVQKVEAMLERKKRSAIFPRKP